MPQAKCASLWLQIVVSETQYHVLAAHTERALADRLGLRALQIHFYRLARNMLIDWLID